jgi:hypothetical protein
MRNFSMIVIERGNHRRKPIRGKILYGQAHAERLAAKRTTQSYTWTPTVVQ